MKKQLVNVLTKFGFLSVIALVTAVGSAEGQSLAYKLRAKIPFDFVVANQKLPPGKYSIGRAIQNSGDSVLLISSVNGRLHAIRWSTPVESRSVKSKGKLVFNRYGDQYFLSQVWPAGASTGRQLYKSRSEREIRRKLAGDSSTPGTTAKKTQAVETVHIVTDLQ
jgi:hypothetical protein